MWLPFTRKLIDDRTQINMVFSSTAKKQKKRVPFSDGENYVRKTTAFRSKAFPKSAQIGRIRRSNSFDLVR